MSRRTESEGLFESFCASHGIPLTRVAVGSGRSPDYEVTIGGYMVVVEVKEIEPSDEERAAMERTAKGEIVVHRVTPGEKVRRKITSQAGQIRSRTKGQAPGLLVLFDRAIMTRHLDPYQIRVAMEGFDTVVFAVPHDSRQGVRRLGTKAGKRKKMTANDNTSISAISVLEQRADGRPELSIFHNRHASTPLDPGLFRPFGVKQYTLSHSEPGGIGEWTEI